MKRTATLSAAGATALLLSSLTPVIAVQPAVLIVGNDKVECPGAAYDSIKAAVKAANPGDTVQVCPGTYRERVLVEKTLTLQGSTKTKNIDCFAADLSALDPTQVSIIEPPMDGVVGPLLSLRADNINVSGFVVQKQRPAPVNFVYEPAIQTQGSHSGYNIRGNIVYNNNLGVEFGSAGITHDSEGNAIGSISTFQGNCLRNNAFAVANQRLELRDALIVDNQSMNNTEKAYELGTGRAGVTKVEIARNTSRDDRVMVSLLRNSSDVTITLNTVHNTSPGPSRAPLRSIDLRHRSPDLKIIDNNFNGAGITGTAIGVTDLIVQAEPLTGAMVTGNKITGYLNGISFTPGAGATDNRFEENNTSGNIRYGIFMNGSVVADGDTTSIANKKNTFKDNTADNNGIGGIYAGPGTSDNTFKENQMHGNAVDAIDVSGTPITNEWKDNSCVRDNPEGLLCTLP